MPINQHHCTCHLCIDAPRLGYWTPDQQREHRRLWVAALRSGEFLQGEDRLKFIDEDDQQRHCCLGVGCDVAIKHGLTLTERLIETDDDEGLTVTMFDDEDMSLNTAVRSWLGLTTSIGDFMNSDGRPSCLTTLNDGSVSFARIADVIESEPPGLIQEHQ